MPKTGIKLDTKEFQAALLQYAQHSKRDMAFIVNKRAMNVAFIALKKTPSATPAKIERNLRKKMAGNGRKGAGRPPLAALLIAHGQKFGGRTIKPSPGLYGQAMADRIKWFISVRKRSRGYVKSGWLKVVRDFERKLGGRAKRQPRNVQDFARLPGEGKAARPGINPTAEVVNHAQAARRIAKGPLQAALSADAADMRKFTAKRMQKTANKFKG